MLNSPVAVGGFYATRLFAHKLIRAALFVALTAAVLAVGAGVGLLAVFDIFVITWFPA